MPNTSSPRAIEAATSIQYLYRTAGKAEDERRRDASAERIQSTIDAVLAEKDEALRDIAEGNFPSHVIYQCAETGNVMAMKDWLQARAEAALSPATEREEKPSAPRSKGKK